MQTRPSNIALAALAALAVLTCPAVAAAQGAKITDATAVAKAGAATITRGALLGYLTRYYGKTALDQLTDRSLLRQEAARLGVTVTEADLDARAAELKRTAGAGFRDALEREGLDEAAWRERVRYALLGEKTLDKKWPVKDTDLVRVAVRYARVTNQNQAKEIIREAKNGASFELLVRQRSLDKENGGLRNILRIDDPALFKVTAEAGLRVGQVSPQPIEAGGYYLVLRLENVTDAARMSPQEKKEAIERIRAYRMPGLLPSARQRFKVEETVPVEVVTGDPKPAPDQVLRKVGAESLARKDLNAFLFRYFGKAGLEPLIERSILTQEAAKRGVSVSDAEVAASASEFQKKAGKAFQAGLEREGITEEDWRERLRYSLLADKIVQARVPVRPEELDRLTVRYIRVADRATADRVIQAAAGGAGFEQLAAQASLDKGDGFIRPRAFMRIENPQVFDAVAKSGVRAGQVIREPLEVGASFVVLKLEARFGPETLTAKERDAAIRRINAYRMDEVLDAVRKSYEIEYLVPMPALAAAAAA